MTYCESLSRPSQTPVRLLRRRTSRICCDTAATTTALREVYAEGFVGFLPTANGTEHVEPPDGGASAAAGHQLVRFLEYRQLGDP